MKTVSKEYALLFNTVTRAIEDLEKLKSALIASQCLAEDIYIQDGEADAHEEDA